MDGIVWKVRLEKETRLEKEKPIICVWNRQERKYEVYYRGCLCGAVMEPAAASERQGEFLKGRVLKASGRYALISIGRRRGRAVCPASAAIFRAGGVHAAA